MTNEVLKQRIFSQLRYTIMLSLLSLGVIGFTLYTVLTVETELGGLIFDWILIGIAGLLFIFESWVTIGGLIDLKDLKRNNLITVRAKFVSFIKKETKKGATTYAGQVFIEEGTGKELALDIIGVEPNKVYTIIYAKHTRLGIPIQK